MGAIRRLSYVGVLVGLLVALVPGGSTVAADAPCQGERFAQRLDCWAGRITEGPVVITLEGPLGYGGIGEGRHDVIKRLRGDKHPVVVLVSKDADTGQGGTALLLIADDLLIHPDATIDRLKESTLADLKRNGVCDESDQLCQKVGPGQEPDTLKGEELKAFAADPADNLIVITDDSNSSTSSGTSGGKGDKNQGENNGDGKGQGGDDEADTPNSEASGYSGSTWTAFWMALLLALLLLAFVIVIRRSRGPVAVGHRAASPRWVVGNPAARAPAHAARGGGGGGDEDERTTRLRIAPVPRHGRQVGARPAHARTAVVRTELHPQGYVEVDRVLRRAVWAEPGRPPPVPGGLVDVADARERDSDVLYAFPPTAARHAKGTPR